MLEEDDARDLRRELAQALLLAGYERVIAEADRISDAADEETYETSMVRRPEALALLRLVDAVTTTFVGARDLQSGIVDNVKEFNVSGVLVAFPEQPTVTTVLVSVEENQADQVNQMIACSSRSSDNWCVRNECRAGEATRQGHRRTVERNQRQCTLCPNAGLRSRQSL